MDAYHLVTDGSVLAYANCGGWSYILQGEDFSRQKAGSRWGLSSNAMELIAIVEGLASIAQSSEVEVFTDSAHVIHNYISRRREFEPVWAEFFRLTKYHDVVFTKVGKNNPDSRHTKTHHLAREAAFNAVREKGSQQKRRVRTSYQQSKLHYNNGKPTRCCFDDNWQWDERPIYKSRRS